MSGERRRYVSYLLRLWQTSERDPQVWRASLDSPGTRNRQGFASLEDLFDYLEGQTRSQDKSEQKTGGNGGNDDRG